jgi:hypothetical protein
LRRDPAYLLVLVVCSERVGTVRGVAILRESETGLDRSFDLMTVTGSSAAVDIRPEIDCQAV